MSRWQQILHVGYCTPQSKKWGTVPIVRKLRLCWPDVVKRWLNQVSLVFVMFSFLGGFLCLSFSLECCRFAFCFVNAITKWLAVLFSSRKVLVFEDPLGPIYMSFSLSLSRTTSHWSLSLSSMSLIARLVIGWKDSSQKWPIRLCVDGTL